MREAKKEIIELIEPYEEFKEIQGYEGLYKVSNLGRVMSLGNNNSNNSKPKILKIGKRRKYGKIMLYKNGDGKVFAIHRIVASSFLGLDLQDTKVLVLHKLEELDENGMLNNKVGNLFLGTYKDNTQDMLKKGRHKAAWEGKYGNEHNKTKKIKQYSLGGDFIKEWNGGYEIERLLGITPQNIYRVCNGQRKTAGGYQWRY